MCVSVNSLNIWNLGALVLSLSDLRPSLHSSLLCTEGRLSSLVSWVSWLPAWFGTCKALVGDEEEREGEVECFSSLPCWGGLSSRGSPPSDPSIHSTDPQVPAFVRWPLPWTQAHHLYSCSSLDCLCSSVSWITIYWIVSPPVHIWSGSCHPGWILTDLWIKLLARGDGDRWPVALHWEDWVMARLWVLLIGHDLLSD